MRSRWYQYEARFLRSTLVEDAEARAGAPSTARGESATLPVSMAFPTHTPAAVAGTGNRRNPRSRCLTGSGSRSTEIRQQTRLSEYADTTLVAPSPTSNDAVCDSTYGATNTAAIVGAKTAA